MNCDKCGKSLRPAPAWFDGEETTVGYWPCLCCQESAVETKRGLMETRYVAAEINRTVAAQINDTGRLLLAERTMRNLCALAKRGLADVTLEQILEA